VFTFDPAPAVLFGTSDGRELTTREEKRLLFERMGVDILIEFPLSATTAAITPQDFVTEVLAKQMNVRFVAAGSDLSFGAMGAGDAKLLERLGGELGFETRVIDKVCLEGHEVSSTYVRSLVESGDMESVEMLLGMPYPVLGTVVQGKQIGRTIGFPTVNILPPSNKLLPPNGVYFSRVRHGEKSYRAISNVGCKPTVSDEKIMGVESYLYDFDEELYGEEIEVYLLQFRRPERRFDGIGALKKQLEEDIREGRKK
jgi:riboflavin kinase/FMN adenylyltransferase